MSRKASARAIVAIVALAAFTVFITWRAKRLETRLSGGSATALAINARAPAFSLPSLSGNRISLSEYRGKKVVVSFWASWCEPCKMEMPELRSFYERYHSANGFEVLAISQDDNPTDPANFAIAQKLPFPVLLDLNQQIGEAYGAEAIPDLYVIDENGRVIYHHLGYDPTMDLQLERVMGIKIAPVFPGAERGVSSN